MSRSLDVSDSGACRCEELKKAPVASAQRLREKHEAR